MSAQKKSRPAASHAEKDSTDINTRRQGSGKLAKDELAIKTSLKERARLMLDYPVSYGIHDETDLLQMQTEESISNLYRSLDDQAMRTSQMCMDAEIRAISAIEERVTAELRLIEADYSCIGMEVHARIAMTEKLKNAQEAVAAARATENAVMTELDKVKPRPGIDRQPDQQDKNLAQKRLSAKNRAAKMQRLRMEAEHCAIQEVESLVAQDDLQLFEPPNQCLSEESILQMALENGMLATQDSSHAAPAPGQAQAQNIDAEAEANQLLDNIRNSTWQTFHTESRTLH